MIEDRKNAILLGQRFAIGTRSELLKEAQALIGVGGVIATVNPIMLVRAVKNPALERALQHSLNIPDGVGIKSALMKRGVETEVFPGVELVPVLLQEGGSVGIVGGEAGVAERAFSELYRHNDKLTLAFCYDGYTFNVSDLKRSLTDTKPKFMLVALGVPKQELLIDEIREYSRKTVYIGIGGSLDIYSGKKRRAPEAFRKSGFEWLYRMIKEPKRLRGLTELWDFRTMETIERRKTL